MIRFRRNDLPGRTRRLATQPPSTPRRWVSLSSTTGSAWCRFRAATGPPTLCRSAPARQRAQSRSAFGRSGDRRAVPLRPLRHRHHATMRFGVMPAPVYCTKIASKIARTYTDRHGLKDLTRELLGVGIAERRRSSDWGAETQRDELAYAASDVLLCAPCAPARRHAGTRGRDGLARAAFAYLPDRVRLDLAGSRRWTSFRTPILRRTSAAFCMATSCLTPPRASPSVRMSSSSGSRAPSAEPWTSTRPPAPVITKFVRSGRSSSSE